MNKEDKRFLEDVLPSLPAEMLDELSDNTEPGETVHPVEEVRHE